MFFYFCLFEGNYFDMLWLIFKEFNMIVEILVFVFLVVIEWVFLLFYESCNNVVCFFVNLMDKMIMIFGNLLDVGEVME